MADRSRHEPAILPSHFASCLGGKIAVQTSTKKRNREHSP